ncbi:hypothetical protein ACNGUO_003495 [Escherichia coli]
MSTKTTKQQSTAAELNAEAVVDDLNAEGTATAALVTAEELNTGDESAGSEGNDSGEEDSSDPEFVVLKGNSVRHNGEVYRENAVIPVTGKDAERLLNAGIIADVSILRQRILAEKPAVTVTTG